MKRWEILTSRYLLRRPWMRLRQDRVQLPNGAEIDEFHVLEYPDWVCVLCLTEEDEAVMVEQYRHGVAAFSLELPAGVIERGEEPLAAAKRELREETGYEATEWTLLGRCAQDPHRQNNFVYCFAARNARCVAEQQLDEGEAMVVRLLKTPRVVQAAQEGAIIHGIHLAALFWAEQQGLLGTS